MGFGCAFNLRHFDNQFISHALLGIGLGQSGPIISHAIKHFAVRHIRIMRDGHQIVSLPARLVHPVPKIFGIS